MTSVDATSLNDRCSDNESSLDENDFSSDDELQSSHSSNSDQSNRPNSHSIWFRARKRLVGHMVNRRSIKSLAGVNTYNVLHELRNLLKLHIESKHEAKQIYRALLKTIGKFAVVARERKLTNEEYAHSRELKKHCRTIGLTCASFVQMDYTYDRAHLINLGRQSESMLVEAAQTYLSERSLNRISYVFNSLLAPEFLDSVFSPNATAEQKKTLNQLIRNFNVVMAEPSV